MKRSGEKEKPCLRFFLTLRIGGILLIGNTLLVLLLLYNLQAAFAGFLIPVNGEMTAYYFDDGLEAHLLFLGVIIAVGSTLLGTLLTYFVLGKVLRPLQQLSEHMRMVEQENSICSADIISEVREVDSLICSFNTMSSKLQDSFEKQKQFSSFIAHEFRTPLAVIQTKIDVFNKQPDQEPTDLVNHILNQVSRLSKLVSQILDLASIQRVELKEKIPVDMMLEEVTEDLEDYADEAQVSLQIEGIPTEKAFDTHAFQVIGNHDLLYQAFFNLVENGIKYNRAGGTVHVVIRNENGTVCVQISDTGGGIPIYAREKIFFPFFRCEQDHMGSIQGNGIGLSFSKQVVEHHRGSLILCDSEEGACFEVRLKEYIPIKRSMEHENPDC